MTALNNFHNKAKELKNIITIDRELNTAEYQAEEGTQQHAELIEAIEASHSKMMAVIEEMKPLYIEMAKIMPTNVDPVQFVNNTSGFYAFCQIAAEKYGDCVISK